MAKKQSAPETEVSFEEAFERLAGIVSSLEAGEGTLTERTALFEEGVRLSRLCSARLDSIERKIEILLESGPSGDAIAPYGEADMDEEEA
jgi:exodeoxyribonuclease VII small subunit